MSLHLVDNGVSVLYTTLKILKKLIDEIEYIDNNLFKLREFLKDKKSTVSKEHAELLIKQEDIMTAYIKVLADRMIDLLKLI